MNNSTQRYLAIKRGLDFIAAKQLKNGGFESFCSQNPNNFDEKAAYRTTFFTSLITGALEGLDCQVSEAIRARAATFLLAQKSNDWSYNYWDKTDANYTKRPYPDDMDDTFCALSALYYYDPSLITGDVLARGAHLLFATEVAAGGPYRTWLVPEDAGQAWKDVDPVVNANIARFLSTQDVRLPAVAKLIEDTLASGKPPSPYYLGNLAFFYFLSGWYSGQSQITIDQLLLDAQGDDFWGSPLNAALCTTTLLRSGYERSKLMPTADYLLSTQQQDGSWPAAAFSIDLRNNGNPIYAGASSLTTALCIEAIAAYGLKADKATFGKKTSGKPALNDDNNEYYQTMVAKAQNVIVGIKQKDLKAGVESIFKRILAKDNDRQILLLPRLVLNTGSQVVSTKTVQGLSSASLWGWMAYTTYDDFLDQPGSRELLPAANFCLRTLTNVLANVLPGNKSFQSDVAAIMDSMDAGSLWELQNCRGTVEKGKLTLRSLPDYTDYWQLADRSLGHTIAGIGVLYAAGYSKDSVDLRELKQFFHHYLIARQLNDDAHDWEDDLREGHVNAVAVRLLQKHPAHMQGKPVDLKREADALRTILWDEVIVDICELINGHTAKSRAALARTGNDVNKDLLGNLLLPVEAAARKSLAERQQALSFIAGL